MKKYFKNQIIFTLSELIQIVEDYPSLGFYFPLEHKYSKDQITIHNWNNGFKGRTTTKFKRESDKKIIRLN